MLEATGAERLHEALVVERRLRVALAVLEDLAAELVGRPCGEVLGTRDVHDECVDGVPLVDLA